MTSQTIKLGWQKKHKINLKKILEAKPSCPQKFQHVQLLTRGGF